MARAESLFTALLLQRHEYLITYLPRYHLERVYHVWLLFKHIVLSSFWVFFVVQLPSMHGIIDIKASIVNIFPILNLHLTLSVCDWMLVQSAIEQRDGVLLGIFKGFYHHFTLILVRWCLRIAFHNIVFISCVTLIVLRIHRCPIHLRSHVNIIPSIPPSHVLNCAEAEVGVDGLAIWVIRGQQAGVVGSLVDVWGVAEVPDLWGRVGGLLIVTEHLSNKLFFEELEVLELGLAMGGKQGRRRRRLGKSWSWGVQRLV